MKPEYIFETSWEVCNRVGGIYTVLSTRAASMQKYCKDKVFFFGPDVWGDNHCPFITIDNLLLSDWRLQLQNEGIDVKIGRWNVPGHPISILIDFNQFYAQKDSIYGHFWELYGVDSLHAYGDYDEASMFGYAAGVVMESLYHYLKLEKKRVVAHFNEWMTAFGLFYVREHMPRVGTLFTTHATSIGRSIAGNNKPLYDYLPYYNGDQMAQELNMVAKHSVEKRAAQYADCFTTVSDITDRECRQLLEKAADVVTPNGFENDFVPKAAELIEARLVARQQLFNVTEKILDYKLPHDTLFVGTSGRYEFKNKGLDVVLQVAKMLNDNSSLNRQIVFYIAVPAWQKGPRQDLIRELNSGKRLLSWNKYTTHELYDYDHDNIINSLRWYGLLNGLTDRVKVIFIPSYLNGDDGIFNRTYYDLLAGMDITIFPSYYEPWGYTPLESVAFNIPTITTNLSGFGQWASHLSNKIENGVSVIERTDSNWEQMSRNIVDQIYAVLTMTKKEYNNIRKAAAMVAQQALWKNFFVYYQEAYQVALEKSLKR